MNENEKGKENITPQEWLMEEIKKEPISKRDTKKYVGSKLSSKERKCAERWFQLLDKISGRNASQR